MTQWIGRLGFVWVEGQVAQVTRRPGQRTAFLTLRDPSADMSLTVTCSVALLDGPAAGLARGRARRGARQAAALRRPAARCRWTPTRSARSASASCSPGSSSCARVLAAEGLFAADRKRPLPFLPERGRRRLRPGVGRREGRARERAAPLARGALPGRGGRRAGPDARSPRSPTRSQRLDADPEVDVIVVTRGGGSLEDLLPFSNEALVRAVAACRTPVVSAIGHEPDTPLLDLVADVRASTPTDAAKRVVPDVAEELDRVAQLRRRTGAAVRALLDREHAGAARAAQPARCRRPARPARRRRAHEVAALRDRARRSLAAALDRAADNLAHTRARVTALSPAATLERGYAVLQRADGAVVRRPADVVGRRPAAGPARRGRARPSVVAADADRGSARAPTGMRDPDEPTRRYEAGPRGARRGGPAARDRRRDPRGVARAVGARRGARSDLPAVARRRPRPARPGLAADRADQSAT